MLVDADEKADVGALGIKFGQGLEKVWESEDDNTTKMGQAAFRHVASNFSWCVGKALLVYELAQRNTDKYAFDSNLRAAFGNSLEEIVTTTTRSKSRQDD